MMLAVLLMVLVVAAASVTAAQRATERTRRMRRMTDGRFLLAFSGLLAKMAMADGTVSAEEVETVEKMFSDMELSRAERALCVGNFVLVQREGGDAKALARELAGTFNHVACRFLYGLVLRVALADAHLAEGEERLLKEVGGELGLGDEERQELRRGTGLAFDRNALEDAGVPSVLAKIAV